MKWISPKKDKIKMETCSRCKNNEKHMTIILGNHGTDYHLCETCYEQYQRRWDLFIDSYIKEGNELRDLIISEINKAIKQVNEDNPNYEVSWDGKIDIQKIERFEED